MGWFSLMQGLAETFPHGLLKPEPLVPAGCRVRGDTAAN